jgi:hypothetical protein
MRKLIAQVTRKPRAASIPNPTGKARAVQEARERLSRLREDVRDARDGFMRGDLDIADLAQE